MSAKQVAILFADVQGFSKLRGAEVDAFVEHVMGALAEAIRPYTVEVKNTWGDAIFILFDTADKAADCALALRNKIRDTPWPNHGIYSDLKIRIALHNAHASISTDPITGQLNAYGAHVNKTARLEPVVTPNEVFATDDFKRALDNFETKVYAWDPLGTLSLAKDWGQSAVYRLRRPSEERWSTSTANLPGTKPPSLDQLMPKASHLLATGGRYPTELRELIAHFDNFLMEGIVRRNWVIQVTYDSRQLRKRGVVIETIQWSYELLNLRTIPMKYNLRQIGAPSLEGKAGLISWHQIDAQGRETKLPLPKPAGRKGPMFEVRSNEIELHPNVLNKFELRVQQEWPASRSDPRIHNSWAPRQVSFVNRLEVSGPIKKIGLLYGDSELQCAFNDEDKYVYNIPSPIMREQVIEILVEFRS
jgi:class 3 adenylate cyclase